MPPSVTLQSGQAWELVVEGKAVTRSSFPTSQGQGEEGGCVRGEKSPAISASTGVHHSVHSDGSSGMGVFFFGYSLWP